MSCRLLVVSESLGIGLKDTQESCLHFHLQTLSLYKVHRTFQFHHLLLFEFVQASRNLDDPCLDAAATLDVSSAAGRKRLHQVGGAGEEFVHGRCMFVWKCGFCPCRQSPQSLLTNKTTHARRWGSCPPWIHCCTMWIAFQLCATTTATRGT